PAVAQPVDDRDDARRDAPGQARLCRLMVQRRDEGGGAPGRGLRGTHPESAPAEEEVRPPGFVAGVLEVRREPRVDVAARLERRPEEPDPGLLGRPPTLAVVARLACGDEVLPRVTAAAMAGQDVVEREVVRLAPAVLAGVPVAAEDLAPRELDPGPRPLDLVLEPDDRGCPEDLPNGPD